MKFTETPLHGAFVIDLEKREDERGFFARYFCKREFEKLGLDCDVTQANNSLSKDRGTLRGMHYQLAPHAETKILRVLSGSLYDVIIDLRPKSRTYMQHFGIELSAENRSMIYVPKGFAHGFLTLERDVETLYLVTAYYSPEHERCVRYNDPTFDIPWPSEPEVISDKDRSTPDFAEDTHLA